MSSLVMTSTTSTEEDMQEALQSAGYVVEQEPVEVENQEEVPAAPPAEKAEEQVPAEEEVEGKIAETPAVPGDTQEKDAKEGTPKGIQKRFDEITRKSEERARKIEDLERKLEDSAKRLTDLDNRLKAGQPKDTPQEEVQQAKPAEVKPVAKPRPKADDFKDYDEYLDAVVVWAIAQNGLNELDKKILEQVDTKLETRFQKESETATKAEVESRFAERLEKAAERIPDIREVIGAADFDITGNMRDVIFDSEIGPDIAVWLAKHPEECARILKLDGPGQVRAMGRLEGEISASLRQGHVEEKETPEPVAVARPVAAKAAPVRHKPVPPPIEPIKPIAAPVALDDNAIRNMPPAEYARRRRSGDIR